MTISSSSDRWMSLALVLLVACGKSDGARDGGIPPPTAAEIAELERGLDADLAVMRGWSCTRPVLRGDAVAGPAADDQAAVLDPADTARQACFTRVQALVKENVGLTTRQDGHVLPKQLRAGTARWSR